MKKILVLLLLTAVPLFNGWGWGGLCGPPAAHALEEWEKSMHEVCGKTQDAMGYSREELHGLIARCDAVIPLVEQLDEPEKTIALKRLKMCRELFVFVLESKEKEDP